MDRTDAEEHEEGLAGPLAGRIDRDLPAPRQPRSFSDGVVVSPHHLASAAGAAILDRGGNAVDAAVAANLVLAVVTPYHCGAGGDLFAIVWDGERAHGLASAGRAPAAATPDAVARACAGRRMPTFGALSVTVPGAIPGWFALLERFGTMSFGDVARPALRFAERGFLLSDHGAEHLLAPGARYDPDDGWHGAYGHWLAGTRPVQLGYARALRELADEGLEAFRNGHLGGAIVETVRDRGGLLAREDLRRHEIAWIEPMALRHDDHYVLELPPPTQGLTALQSLGMWRRLRTTDPLERLHTQIEIAKIALAERAAFVTDPAHISVDVRDLYGSERLDDMAEQVDPERAAPMQAVAPHDGGTAYLNAADDRGMCVSLIQSNFMGFGSGVVLDGYGIPLHNRGASFSLDPEDVNLIAPGKQPMHTLIPAMVLRDGRPTHVFGTMGGDGQAQFHLQILSSVLDDGPLGHRDPQAAVDAPRWVVDPATGDVTVESRIDPAHVDALRRRGHTVTVTRPYAHHLGHAHLISVEAEGYRAGTDPRAEGAAVGR